MEWAAKERKERGEEIFLSVLCALCIVVVRTLLRQFIYWSDAEFVALGQEHGVYVEGVVSASDERDGDTEDG